MNETMCPKCGCECVSRFLIIHGDNGRELCEEYYCEECAKIIRRAKIIFSEPITILQD